MNRSRAFPDGAGSPSKDPILSSWRAIFELCRDLDFRRTVLIDSPKDLGRGRWSHSAATLAAMERLTAGGGDPDPTSRQLVVRAGLVRALAAVLIVEAAVEDELRVRERGDVVLLDWLTRLMPVTIPRPMARLARQQLAALVPPTGSSEGEDS